MALDISSFINWFINSFLDMFRSFFSFLDGISFYGFSLLDFIIVLFIISAFLPVIFSLLRNFSSRATADVARFRRNNDKSDKGD